MPKEMTVENVPGFRVAAVQADIRDWEKPRNDLALIAADAPAAAAGVFTLNQVAAAPVKIDRKHLKASGGVARALLVNAGVANACTGAEGNANAMACVKTLSKALDAPANQILVASTGVIGRQLPMDRMQAGITAALGRLGKAKQGEFARAIMTTDTKVKQASVMLSDNGGSLIAGACKGSGMIAPNMATMLGFVLTDAAISPKALAAAMDEVTAATFNTVIVDGDTSTNDSFFVLASGVSGAKRIDRASGKDFDRFVEGLYYVAYTLARAMAADGEGATKMVNVNVTGARNRKDAVEVARTIAQSPLVKTAMFGNDPNWGRIVAAAGRSNAKVDESRVTIRLCGKDMFVDGAPLDFDKKALSKKMRAKELDLEVELGLGEGCASVLTCDFSYDYVKINADYTT